MPGQKSRRSQARERRVKHLLQPAVLVFNRLHLRDHRGIHPAIFCAPFNGMDGSPAPLAGYACLSDDHVHHANKESNYEH